MRGCYLGVRSLDSCFGNALFKRAAAASWSPLQRARLPIACARASSTTWFGWFVISAAQSRKVERKPCTVRSPYPMRLRTAPSVMSESGAPYFWSMNTSPLRPAFPFGSAATPAPVLKAVRGCARPAFIRARAAVRMANSRARAPLLSRRYSLYFCFCFLLPIGFFLIPLYQTRYQKKRGSPKHEPPQRGISKKKLVIFCTPPQVETGFLIRDTRDTRRAR
jgi:hypothetical protein